MKKIEIAFEWILMIGYVSVIIGIWIISLLAIELTVIEFFNYFGVLK